MGHQPSLERYSKTCYFSRQVSFVSKNPLHLGMGSMLKHNVIPLVKSVTKERIIENLKINFTISCEDMYAIDNITTCGGSYKDSDNINF